MADDANPTRRPSDPSRIVCWDAAELSAAGLTAAEQRVAALVAAGHPNREVAAQLYVSIRTVEGHLGQIYRKLDLRGRTELAARIEPAR